MSKSRIFNNPIVHCLLFVATIPVYTIQAQQVRPLTADDKLQIERNIANTSDWSRLQELESLKNNFPGMAGYYNSQIEDIYDRNRYTLISIQNSRRDNEWQLQQQNTQHTQTFNTTLPVTQDDILLSQQNQRDGQPPKLTQQEQRIEDLAKLLTEVSGINHELENIGYYQSQPFIQDYGVYQDVFRQLKNMLTSSDVSLAHAMYLVESAYGNLQLTYEEYMDIINQSATFMHQWMEEQNLDLHNPEAVHYTIQTFMGETMTIQQSKKLPSIHKPFIYDYVDFRAVEDYRNYFLTKTLATGSGQCNTLPRVYLVLAEAMQVEAYLSFAPNHSFIKYKNNNGTIQNYETTVHWHLTNQDYMAEMPITLTAIQNHLYLDTLSKKQIIASLMVDLATTFMREHWLYDGTFVNECIEYSLQYNLNSEGLLLKNLVLASQLEQALAKEGITELNMIQPNTKAEEIYIAYQNSEAELEALGIQAFPEEQYNALLEKHDQRGRLQQVQGVDTKSKKSLFLD